MLLEVVEVYLEFEKEHWSQYKYNKMKNKIGRNKEDEI